jgi:hypothetical protein
MPQYWGTTDLDQALLEGYVAVWGLGHWYVLLTQRERESESRGHVFTGAEGTNSRHASAELTLCCLVALLSSHLIHFARSPEVGAP